MMSKNNISRKGKRKLFRKKLLIVSILILISFIGILISFNFLSSRSKVVKVTDPTVPKLDNKSNSNDENTSSPGPQEGPKVPSKEEILLSATGDVLIGTDSRFTYSDTLVNVFAQQGNDYSYFMNNVKSIFEKDDLTFVNLETPLTDTSSNMAEKQFAFKGPEAYTKILTEGNIEAVNISNNHIYDYGKQGYLDTINTLKQSNINYFGENNIWRTEIKGVKFGFLGYTGWSNSESLLKKIKEDIETLKKENRIVVVNFHWGIEREYYPNSVQKYLAKYSIDNGADLIVSHHPHVVQGIELYKGKIIAYSLGNFCFGGNRNPSDKRTFILQIKFNFENSILKDTAIRVIPCNISSVSGKNNYQPTPMKGKEKADFLKFINDISPKNNFNISDEFFYLGNLNENKN